MIFTDVSKGLKKVSLSVVLLLTPVLLQAETSGGGNLATPKVINEPVSSQPATDNLVSNHKDGHNADLGFPQWQQRQRVDKEIIPPPPPGPYMSSALSDYSVKGPSFGRNYNKPVYRHDPSFVPMDMFSPDIPWPNNLRGNKNSNANRWMPKNGYRYVQPQPIKQTAPRGDKRQQRNMNTGPQYPGNYNMPNMNMNGSRWMPSMGYTPRGPNYNGPSNREKSSNNYVARPAQPPYRAQNPRYNQSGPN
ncbi:MAG: hypothetical protein IMF17_00470 [Proteobacteria bacterium]|nr:hypothetical protein [Pseudomonadota bacterium]